MRVRINIQRGATLWCVVVALGIGAMQTACQKPTSLLDKAHPGAGTTQVIDVGDPNGDVGWWPKVVFDAHDQAHIAYCDAHYGNVRYGALTPSGWKLETVAEKGKTGKYVSLAIRPDGGVGLTYYDQSTHYFDYATRASTDDAWHTEHVAWGLEAGMASTLQYAADGHAHVLYYIPSGKLIHASRSPDPNGTWLKTEVGDYQSVYSAHIGALSGPDGLYFSYVDWKMDAATLYLAHLDQTGWHERTIPTGRGAGWRSALTRVGHDLWVMHSDGLTENTALSFLGLDDQWHDLMLVRGGSSFAVDAWSGRGVMAFAQRNKRHRGLYLTRQVDQGLWPVEEIASGVGNDPDVSLAIDSHGQVLVVYYDVSIHGLKSYTTRLSD